MVLESHFEEFDDSRCHEALLQIADSVLCQSTLAELCRELIKLLHGYFSFQIAGSCFTIPVKMLCD